MAFIYSGGKIAFLKYHPKTNIYKISLELSKGLSENRCITEVCIKSFVF